MLSITNYEGTSTESLTPRGRPGIKKNIDGLFELKLNACESDNPHSFSLITEESIIDAGGFQFRIKQMERSSRGNVKSVLAQHIFFDNIWRRQEGTQGGNRTFDEFATFALRNTGWTFTKDFGNENGYIESFGNANVIKLINQIREAFECEFEIVSNNTIHFSKMLGPDVNFIYQHGDNIIELNRSVSTDNLRTRITAKGKDDLLLRFVSPQAEKWGIRDADDISDERFTNEENLMDKARKALIDQPEISIEVDTIELLDRELGERVWLIYEQWDYELQARILEVNYQYFEDTDDFHSVSVVIGNALPITLSDQLTETQDTLTNSIKEYRSAITQTDENIRLEVERIDKSIAAIDIKADEIDLSVNNRITQEMAAINLKADNINLSVNNRITNEVAQLNIRADSITAEVSRVERKADSTQTQVSSLSIEVGQISTRVANVDNRLGSAESTIIQQAGQISSKVSQTDYNGNTIASLINQTSTTVSISARKINLNGAVMVNGDISGATNININKEITVGENIRMSGSGTSTIYFADMTNITSNQGNIGIYANHNIDLQGSRITLYGDVDLSRATSVNGVAKGHTPGIGIAYNNSTTAPRIYFRINGSNVGYVDLKN
ncbi:phage tail protein [Lysinibacillus pakistanensis]|uniref:phage tail protein n=1 Tax=Lysinibacillus pakistanensis TaxID=759811 RepID=UPI003D2A64CE